MSPGRHLLIEIFLTFSENHPSSNHSEDCVSHDQLSVTLIRVGVVLSYYALALSRRLKTTTAESLTIS